MVDRRPHQGDGEANSCAGPDMRASVDDARRRVLVMIGRVLGGTGTRPRASTTLTDVCRSCPGSHESGTRTRPRASTTLTDVCGSRTTST